MKKILLVLAVLLLSVFRSNAQEEFSTYTGFGEVFKIEISGKSEKDFTLWVSAESLDKSYKQAGFCIAAKKYDDFVIALMQSKEKFSEWKAVAIENKVEKLSKPIKTTFPVTTGFFYTYSEWQFAFNRKLEPVFMAVDIEGKTECWLSLKMYSMISSSNQFIKHDGISLSITSEEIEDFLTAISYEKIIKHFAKKNKKEELFND